MTKSPFTLTECCNPQVILITIIERAQDQEGKDQIKEKRKVLGILEPAQRLYFVTLSNKSCRETEDTLFICSRGGGDEISFFYEKNDKMKYIFSGTALWRIGETTSSRHFEDGNFHRCHQIFEFWMFHFNYYLILQRRLLCQAWSGLLFASTGWLDCFSTLTRQTINYAPFLVIFASSMVAVSLLVQIDIWRAIVTLRAYRSALYVYRFD